MSVKSEFPFSDDIALLKDTVLKNNVRNVKREQSKSWAGVRGARPFCKLGKFSVEKPAALSFCAAKV